MDTNLAQRMIDRANKDGLSHDHELRVKAIDFEEAAQGFFAEEQTVSIKKFMACFARAKMAWCDYSGDTLI